MKKSPTKVGVKSPGSHELCRLDLRGLLDALMGILLEPACHISHCIKVLRYMVEDEMNDLTSDAVIVHLCCDSSGKRSRLRLTA